MLQHKVKKKEVLKIIKNHFKDLKKKEIKQTYS